MMLNCYIMLYLPHTAAHFDTVIITVHSANRIPLATTHSWQDEHVAATPALRRPAGPGQTPWGLSGHRRCASGGWPLPCAPWCGWPSTWPRPWPRQLQSWRWCRCSKKPQLQALGSRCSQGGAATGVRHLRHIMIIMASLPVVGTCCDMLGHVGTWHPAWSDESCTAEHQSSSSQGQGRCSTCTTAGSAWHLAEDCHWGDMRKLTKGRSPIELSLETAAAKVKLWPGKVIISNPAVVPWWFSLQRLGNLGREGKHRCRKKQAKRGMQFTWPLISNGKLWHSP